MDNKGEEREALGEKVKVEFEKKPNDSGMSEGKRERGRSLSNWSG